MGGYDTPRCYRGARAVALAGALVWGVAERALLLDLNRVQRVPLLVVYLVASVAACEVGTQCFTWKCRGASVLVSAHIRWWRLCEMCWACAVVPAMCNVLKSVYESTNNDCTAMNEPSQ